MNKLIILAGTNASGKSGLGIELAKMYHSEIVSADSRQVYKGLDLGSGKVTKDEMQGIPHHLIDVVNPNDFYSLYEFQQQAYAAIDDIQGRGRLPFMVGGTGLYVNAVADGYDIRKEKIDSTLRREIASKSIEELIAFLEIYDPEILKTIDLRNKRRLERAVERVKSGNGGKRVNAPRYDVLELGVTWPRDVLYERIRIRLDRRLDQGMIEEVASLKRNGATDEFLYGLGLEYRFINMYLNKEFISYEAFYDKLFMEIRHLAREQMTWFRKRKNIHWLNMGEDPLKEASTLINAFIN